MRIPRFRHPASSAVVALAALAVVATGSALTSQTPVEIVFSAAPDGSGTVERLVRDFNRAHRGEIEVVWREMPSASDAHREALLDDLRSDPGGIDVLAADVVWTASLAQADLVEDLTDRFYDDLSRDAFLPAPLRSATWRLRIRGVPWYADAGLLFYRRDRLAEAGIDGPPATWDELATAARQAMEATDTRHGFVFQGAPNEAGTANAAEFIWSAGGSLLTQRLTVTGLVVNAASESDAVTVDTPEAARGLDIARGLVEDGVAPARVADFSEEEALAAFRAGEAVFLRSWPYALRVLREAGFTDDQVGVAALPSATPGLAGASCLGGWNLMISAASTEAEQEAAWAFIRFLAEPAQQRMRARDAGLLPVLRALYDDAELQAGNPIIGLGATVFATQLRERPMSPLYGELSSRVAQAFNRTLRGELTGAEATRLLDRELREIVVRNR